MKFMFLYFYEYFDWQAKSPLIKNSIVYRYQ
jgi:hypothetical protein